MMSAHIFVKMSLLFGVFLFLCIKFHRCNTIEAVAPTGSEDLFISLTDENWEQITNGEWLIGIFHASDKNDLQNDWNVLALKCREFGIKTALVKADENPALQVRFLVTEFPKVFYIKDEVVRVFSAATRAELVRVIKDKKWNELDIVSSYLSPLSVHISAFSFLCSQALKLYNFEKNIISSYVDSTAIVNTTFCLTFILFGTALGLILSCFYQLVKFMMYGCSKKTVAEPKKLRRKTNSDTSEDSVSNAEIIGKANVKTMPASKLRKRRN